MSAVSNCSRLLLLGPTTGSVPAPIPVATSPLDTIRAPGPDCSMTAFGSYLYPSERDHGTSDLGAFLTPDGQSQSPLHGQAGLSWRCCLFQRLTFLPEQT